MLKLTTIDRKPTLQDECGSYRHIDAAGLYWGCYYIGFNWAGRKFVAEADERDGLPW
jgi:hypothetical protein